MTVTAACSPFRDEIALRAGGDEPSGPESVAVEAHLGACEPCRELLAELEAQGALVARIAETAWVREASAVSVAAPVLAKLAVEAHQSRAQEARGPRQSSDGGLIAFGRAAAIAVVVTAAALVGLHSLAPGDGPVAEVAEAGVATGKEMDGQPAFVRRVAGEAVELTWAGDGRETGRQGFPAGT